MENKWISVDTLMPKAKQLVLACTAGHKVVVLAAWGRKDKTWFVPEFLGGANNGFRPQEFFSHWMPLPEPPAAEPSKRGAAGERNKPNRSTRRPAQSGTGSSAGRRRLSR